MADLPTQGAAGFGRSVLPSGDLAYQSVQSNPNDFGAQVGQAEQALGGQIGTSSDMLANRVLATQQLANDAAVDRATAQYQRVVTAATAAHHQQMGRAAVDGLPVFTDTLQTARDNLSANLPPTAQRAFDNATAGITSWAANGAATHAATQAFGAAVESKKDAISSAQNDAVTTYNDDLRSAIAIGTIRDKAKELGTLQGWNPQQTNLFFQSQVSSMMKARALAANNAGDPMEAMRILKSDGPDGIASTGGDDTAGVPLKINAITGLDRSAILSQIQRPYDNAVAQRAALATLQTAPQAQTPTPSPTQQGLDNNLGNIRSGPDSFNTYASPADGVVAAANLVRTYPKNHGADTLRKIGAVWAPAGDGDNDPSQWAVNVGKFANLDPDAKLNLEDPATLQAVVTGIARQEKGAAKAAMLNPADVQAGVQRSLNGETVQATDSAPAPQNKDPYLSSLLDKLDADPTLTDAQRTLAKTQLTNQYRQATSNLQAQLEPRLNAEVAAIRDRGYGVGVTEDEIRQAYPGTAPQIISNLNREKQFYDARQQVSLTSPTEDAAIVQKLSPTTASGIDYADQAAKRDMLKQAIVAKQKALTADPVGYVASASPEIGSLYAQSAIPQNASAAQIANANGKFTQALALTQKLQDQLGVPPDQQHVLSKDQAAQMVKDLGSDPVQAVKGLDMLAQRFGDYWQGAFKDLSAAGLPPTFKVAATVDDPKGRVDLMDAIQQGKTLEQALPEGTKSDIKSAVADALTPFRSSLHYNTGGASTYGQVADTTLLLAQRYVGQGMSPEQAADAAAHVTVNGKYDFVNRPANLSGPGFNVRVPSGLGDDVTAKAWATLNTLKPEDMLPVEPGRIGLALGMAEEPHGESSTVVAHVADTGSVIAGRTARFAQSLVHPGAAPTADWSTQYRQQQALTAAKRGTWVTDPEMRGLVLMDNRGIPALKADGTPITVPFADARGYIASRSNPDNGEPNPAGGF